MTGEADDQTERASARMGTPTWTIASPTRGREAPSFEWTVKQTHSKCPTNAAKRSSIYLAMDEELLQKAQSSHLHFQKKEQSLGYEVALEILQAVGWSPSTVYDAPLFIAPEKKDPAALGNKIGWRFLHGSETQLENDRSKKGTLKRKV